MEMDGVDQIFYWKWNKVSAGVNMICQNSFRSLEDLSNFLHELADSVRIPSERDGKKQSCAHLYCITDCLVPDVGFHQDFHQDDLD